MYYNKQNITKEVNDLWSLFVVNHGNIEVEDYKSQLLDFSQNILDELPEPFDADIYEEQIEDLINSWFDFYEDNSINKYNKIIEFKEQVITFIKDLHEIA